MGLTIDTSKINARLDKALAKLPEIRIKFLQKLGQVLLIEIHIQVPHDTGLLEASLFAEVNADGTILTVGTRGCEYAAAVHEAVGKHFVKAGSKAKFIEDPVNQIDADMLNRIKEWAINEIFGE
jgi:hypothetical protein